MPRDATLTPAAAAKGCPIGKQTESGTGVPAPSSPATSAGTDRLGLLGRRGLLGRPVPESLPDQLATLLQVAVGQLLGGRVDPERRLHAREVDGDVHRVDADVGREPIAVVGGEVQRRSS